MGLFGVQHFQQGTIDGLKHCIESFSITQILLSVIDLLSVKRWGWLRERDFRFQIPYVCN